jgi:hypothetical protein
VAITREAPLLIVGFNRPDKLRQLIDSLRPQQPENLVVSLDGPRPNREADTELVRRCRGEVELIDWPCSLELIAHESNVGLRKAVQNAVTHTVNEYGSVIVVEDDVIVGPQFMEFMNSALKVHATNHSVMHINGYNVVPEAQLSNPIEPCRLTRYPESFAWATWERAWRHYDESLTWATNVAGGELNNLLGGVLSGMRWRRNFADAKAERINTWAYRWIASIWEQGGFALSPNRNLVTYNGYDIGTHTRLNATWPELPIEELSDFEFTNARHDKRADRWVGTTVFGESIRGNLLGIAASAMLELRHRNKQLVKKSQ